MTSSPVSQTPVRAGVLRSSPEAIVILGGALLITYGLVLLSLTGAIQAMEFYAPLFALFTALGVLVAHDARRRGRNALAWGLPTLFFGPLVVILYVWAKWGAQTARSSDP